MCGIQIRKYQIYRLLPMNTMMVQSLNWRYVACLPIRSLTVRVAAFSMVQKVGCIWGEADFKLSSEPKMNQDHRCQVRIVRDRKSTRLNSSHVRISYAVFCLKKKKHI